MIDKILTSLFLFIIRYWQAHRDRSEFKDLAEQYRALLESLEKANISVEDKNEILADNVVKLLRGADRLRKSED